MNFAEKIEELRSRAQETQAANKIIDMLKHIESKNDITTSYRWIWELIQNAKDVANTRGLVDILIEFNEIEKYIAFKHNGKLFSTKNIIFLIEQVSTKERGKVYESTKKTTGKFGTGFLTTHLLSKKVTVSGYLQDVGEKPYSFSIDIDRSSDEQSDIISSIEESCNQLDKNSAEITTEINENDYNTCFTYRLDADGVNTAKQGLNNLVVSAPYVFAFVPEINSIIVHGCLRGKEFDQTIVRGKTKSTALENMQAMCIEVNTNGMNTEKYILMLQDNTILPVSIAVEVNIQDNLNFVQPFSSALPKLFCDFPLLGTSDFPFPVVINSSAFNPTEPRDGVYLTQKQTEIEEPTGKKENRDITENKLIMSKAVELYNVLLEYFSQHNYKSIYNITRVSAAPVKDWLSEVWINENINERLKLCIQQIDLIETYGGTKKPLKDEWEEACVLIPNHSEPSVRRILWDLLSGLYPNMITKREELEWWYDSLWDACHNYSVEDLISNVGEFQNMSSLGEAVNGDTVAWLKQFYSLIYAKENGFAKKLSEELKVVPNQNGDFCAISSLNIDCGIEETYKDVLLFLDLDIRSVLVDKNFAFISQNTYVNKYKFENLETDIKKALRSDYVKAEEFYKRVIRFKSKELEKQNAFLDLAKHIYREDNWNTYKVTSFSSEIFEMALSVMLQELCSEISECESITAFKDAFEFENTQTTIEWISKFVDYLTTYKMESLFDQYALLPNQNGELEKISELYLDSGEIDDVVKNVCVVIGDDVRERLLVKDIYCKMPRSRTVTNENISSRITDYIELHKNKLGETQEEKIVFRNFYLYLSENRHDKYIENAFSKLLTNLNWLYNDDDIAEKMRVVKEYNDILSKHGISSTLELEAILSRYTPEQSELEKIEISPELLAQWGITAEEELQAALASRVIGPEFVYTSANSIEMFRFVQEILERAKQNVISYLSTQREYDLSNITALSKTIFVVNKHDEEIYIIARPSDYDQVIIYYDFEKDVLDYQKDWELWVENGFETPRKITFGGILKLTGINKIPLRRV